MPITAAQADQLITFAELLLTWSKHINLTGAKSMKAIVNEHYPDSFAVASRLSGEERLVDVGSGGGLPALPLAVLCPALRISMVEPLAKKVAFLRTAVRELGFANATVVPGRAEALLGSEPGFDVAVSRATFAPAEWVVLGSKLVRPGGRVVVLTVPGTELGQPTSKRIIYLDGRRALVEVSVPMLDDCST